MIRTNVVSLAVSLALVVLTLPAACASSRASKTPVAHHGVGIVVAINADKGRVKLNHEAIEGYMDAMTMWFEAKDPKMLEGLAPNDKVEFVLSEEDSADVLTEIKKIG